ncbi:thiol-disulfide oxidoreductase DCC family protein [Jiella mangrovi]|uniref:DUF393 domain-containing protein n=1 Tax=Jiella mangrovi TaxID=2821407 RepID=A0ABS4BKV7_9HYPH|nr:DCC1-like thiol-disulfide oxidoreductase family protein [Jiella mangrovi]MBP0617367.1 DUF393 domain-containing protein [Jiella mangrovi]
MRQVSPWPDNGVILYDGVCVLCSGWVRFVARRDATRRFRFTPIQSAYGAAMAEALAIDPADPDTNAVVIDKIAYFQSDAVLAVLSPLPGWTWTRIGFAVPTMLRDPLYRLIARNRYRIFGQHEACELPPAGLATRIVTEL